MKLYEISEAYRNLFDSLEEASLDEERTAEEHAEFEDAWFSGLVMLDGLFDEKAASIGAWVKELEADAKEMKEAEKRIAARRKAKENLVTRLKAYLLGEMTAVNRVKVETPQIRVSIRNNAETAQFDNESAFIEWAKRNCDDFLRYAEPEINKTAVKEYLKQGGEIEGVTLGRSQSVLIK